uniref:hypothetical protein n=1 Tax=uncultured Draconibacterium sp. TaxID=1573823 RepID=UPI003217D3C8
MEESRCINESLSKLPVKTTLSFEYLIDKLNKISRSNNHPMKVMAEGFLEKLEQSPWLKKPLPNKSILNENKELLSQLMSFVFNPMNEDIDVSAAFSPFSTDPFFATERYNKTIAAEHRSLELADEIGPEKMHASMLYQAYLFIFEKIYNIHISDDLPFTFKLIDKNDNSVRFFKKRFNLKYLKVKPGKKSKTLCQEEIKELFDNSGNIKFWLRKIPLNQFEFSGFVQFNYIDVTHDYVLSQLKSDLLDKNTILSDEGFLRIKEKVRALFDNPNVEFGIAAYNRFETILNKNIIWKTIIPQTELNCTQYAGTIYEKAFMKKQIQLTDDFREIEKDVVVEAFLKKGIRSHAIVPLTLEDEIVGMLEFGCNHPGGLNMIQLKRLHDLFPIFALALKRSMQEWKDRVRGIIQEEFTAIHPTVEWRFWQAAANLLAENTDDESNGIEPIIFSEVVPIYGASDVRASSIERNNAIQSDLTEQLEHAWEILEYGMQVKEMPLLDDLSFKIRQHIKTVKTGLKAGDEVVILDFLKKDIDPVLLLLKERHEEMQEPVNNYMSKLDPELHVLYRKRKDFENSLTLINDKVSEIIDSEQLKAQDVFPHYFEKYHTDGVEYNGYIGQSLVQNLKYSDVYLKNIRLWQLLVQVKIARKIQELQPQLPIKLDITQLILVHSNPLSIAFRQDEKKFDVAGAYNIRYEITKKRIDKAHIKGTNERITQVGKIAIIYSHADEIHEYKKYIDYMISQGYLTNKVEELELEDLKGASGLHAIRVEVDFSDLSAYEINTDIIEEVVTRN